MFKWFFIASYFCIVASERKTFTFDPQERNLVLCIKHQLESIDSQYKSTKISSELASLAARRFHGKSLFSDAFNKRFKQFSFQLRNHTLKYHEITKNEFSKQVQATLKQALINCGKSDSQSSSSRVTIIQENEWISFSPNKNWVLDCIKSHLKLTNRWEFHQEDGFTEFIADCAVRRFSGKSLSKKAFDKNTKSLFYNLRKNKISHNVSTDKLSHGLELSVTQAIEDCAIDKTPLVAVPTFENEPIETAHLLNLILVKWPRELRHMIQSRIGRALLRMYANDAWTALIQELNVFQNNTEIFRLALRSFWNNRARQMYDAYSEELHYIVHRYTFNYPTPHMVLSEFDEFINRNSSDFNKRNPPAPKSYLNRILNIHKSDYSDNNGEVDIFDNYNINGMTYAQLYFEYQLNQFYRIIFFFLELCAKGICTDEDDLFYDGSLPNFLIPEQIQAIIYDDDAYRDYLLDERSFFRMLMGNEPQIEIAQTLLENARVLEENLILLRSHIPSTSGIHSGCETATTTRTTTIATTQSHKRKDDIWKNENGKCFSKRRKISSTTDNNNNINQNLDSKNLNQDTNLSVEKNNNYLDGQFTRPPEFDVSLEQDEIDNYFYGYMQLSDDDFNELQILLKN